jgi:isopentenyl diphosphate isomerase/L-lactate dehydrogenase-like FMN-dependent dehydrogenase
MEKERIKSKPFKWKGVCFNGGEKYIADGYDAFKALALGADLVCVGRALMEPYLSGGPMAMAETLRQMTGELRGMMARTGSRDLRHIDPAVIHRMP